MRVQFQIFLRRYSKLENKSESKLREYGVGAQILIDLGIKKMKLISDSNTIPLNLEGYDLEGFPAGTP